MTDPAELRHLPKVVLHDHLDGGLRPATVIELADAVGHALPSRDADELGRWFFEAADSGSLVEYLTTFEHTVAVMQTADALRRVAREFVEDLAGDGVVYAEARWAPTQHLSRGLTLEEAVVAVGEGLAEGEARAAASGRRVVARQLVTAMRHEQPSTDVARLAIDRVHPSVVGYDLAGPEAGFPPGRWQESLDALRAAGVPYTLHAGEAAGLDSIAEAVELGASRIGHGARLADDLDGELARRILDARIVLELCPSSNLQTGLAASMAEHPFGRLERAGMAVTVNCDNRLMSRTTMSREMALLVDAFGYTTADLHRFTTDAARAAFLPEAERDALVADVIDPGYALESRA